MLALLRHLDPEHRYFNKTYKSKEVQKKIKAPIDRKKQELLSRYANDMDGMPRLKGSKPGAKTKIYTNMAKTKRPGKAELMQRGANFQ